MSRRVTNERSGMDEQPGEQPDQADQPNPADQPSLDQTDQPCDQPEQSKRLSNETSRPDLPALSPQAQRALDLYRRLEAVRLETAYLHALRAIEGESHGSSAAEPASQPSAAALEEARRDLLRAKAAYTQRQTTIEAVLIAPACLEAADTEASPSQT
jgi:hypothetical protein